MVVERASARESTINVERAIRGQNTICWERANELKSTNLAERARIIESAIDMSDPVLTDGEPCGCAECCAAGVEHEPVRAVPSAGLIHGYALKKFVLARAAFFAEAKRLGYPVPKEWR